MKIDLVQFFDTIETNVYEATIRGMKRAEKDMKNGARMREKTAQLTAASAAKRSPKASAADKAAKPTRATGEKRSKEDLGGVMAAVLYEVMKNAADGIGVEKLGPLLNMSTKELALPIRKLLGDKKLKTKGSKRATRYFPTSK